MTTLRAGILGTGSALPQRVLTNADLEKMVQTSDEWIVTRTGIRERRIADAGEATSDYALAAGVRALEAAGLGPEAVDLVICATITPDMLFPATACLVQDRLGAASAAAFDMSAACTGFVYALGVAAGMVESGRYRHVLVIAADLLSRVVDYEDRKTCVLFGDGAGAVVVGPAEEGRGILAFDLGSDGSGAAFLYQPAGGSRLPASAESVATRQHYIRMEGQETFKYAVKAMTASTERVLGMAGLRREDVDLLVPHQANIRIIEAMYNRFGLAADKVAVTVHKYGNTSGSSIPIALDEAVREGRVRPGDVLVMVGFGAGLTWGSAVVRW